MLVLLAVVLIVLWVTGLATAYTFGGLIHLLIVIAIIMLLVRLINGKTA